MTETMTLPWQEAHLTVRRPCRQAGLRLEPTSGALRGGRSACSSTETPCASNATATDPTKSLQGMLPRPGIAEVSICKAHLLRQGRQGGRCPGTCPSRR